MKKAHLITIVLCLFFACSEDEPNHTSVKIRLRNVSQFEFTDVFVNTSGGEFNYGSLNSQGVTPYHEFESAYSYAFVSLKIDGINYRIQPIDYVGEVTLPNGIYTYEIAAKASGGEYDRLSMSLVKD
jgi:hypothetical protein